MCDIEMTMGKEKMLPLRSTFLEQIRSIHDDIQEEKDIKIENKKIFISYSGSTRDMRDIFRRVTKTFLSPLCYKVFLKSNKLCS